MLSTCLAQGHVGQELSMKERPTLRITGSFMLVIWLLVAYTVSWIVNSQNVYAECHASVKRNHAVRFVYLLFIRINWTVTVIVFRASKSFTFILTSAKSRQKWSCIPRFHKVNEPVWEYMRGKSGRKKCHVKTQYAGLLIKLIIFVKSVPLLKCKMGLSKSSISKMLAFLFSYLFYRSVIMRILDDSWAVTC